MLEIDRKFEIELDNYITEEPESTDEDEGQEEEEGGWHDYDTIEERRGR